MNEDHKEFIVALVIFAAIVLVIAGYVLGWFQGETEEETVFRVFIDDDPVLGAEDAPITIVEFSDFACSFCALFSVETKPILQEYIDNGTVRFAFKDYPLTQLHPRAAQVAKAAGCADEQGAFWEYHDLLYENVDRQEIANLRAYAEQTGMNLTAYDECFASDRRFLEIQEDIQQGRELGVTGTPTFFINGVKRVGYISPEELPELLS